MRKRIRNLVLASVAAGVVFAGGVATASGGNYCPDFNSMDCVYTDTVVDESCCKQLDQSGMRLWTCKREMFWCIEGWSMTEALGEGFECHSPGAYCQ